MKHVTGYQLNLHGDDVMLYKLDLHPFGILKNRFVLMETVNFWLTTNVSVFSTDGSFYTCILTGGMDI